MKSRGFVLPKLSSSPSCDRWTFRALAKLLHDWSEHSGFVSSLGKALGHWPRSATSENTQANIYLYIKHHLLMPICYSFYLGFKKKRDDLYAISLGFNEATQPWNIQKTNKMKIWSSEVGVHTRTALGDGVSRSSTACIFLLNKETQQGRITEDFRLYCNIW